MIVVDSAKSKRNHDRDAQDWRSEKRKDEAQKEVEEPEMDPRLYPLMAALDVSHVGTRGWP